jgi:hypothetical protein
VLLDAPDVAFGPIPASVAESRAAAPAPIKINTRSAAVWMRRADRLRGVATSAPETVNPESGVIFENISKVEIDWIGDRA